MTSSMTLVWVPPVGEEKKKKRERAGGGRRWVAVGLDLGPAMGWLGLPFFFKSFFSFQFSKTGSSNTQNFYKKLTKILFEKLIQNITL